MRQSRPSARRRARSFLAPAAIAVGAGMLTTTLPYAAAAPGAATAVTPRAGDVDGDNIPDNLDPDQTEAFSSAVNGLADTDKRVATVAPTLVQKQAAQRLDADVRWGRYGTPSSIAPTKGVLGARTDASAVKTARGWMLSNRALLGLTEAQVQGLDLVNDQRMARSEGHAVLFRQSFGDLVSALDGMITVGVGPQGVAYVSSSLTKATDTPAAPTLSPQDAWLAAANDVGVAKAAGDLGALTEQADTGFTTFKVAGIVQQQQVRLRALAVSNSSVRPVYETNVVDVQGGKAVAYTSYVDAQSGTVLARRNQVDNLASGGRSAVGVQAEPVTAQPFSGVNPSGTPAGCVTVGPFAVAAGQKTIVVGATAANVANDIVLNLKFNGQQVASSDTATSPEVITYSPAAPGEYTVEVCPFQGGDTPFIAPSPFTGVFSTSDQAIAAPGTTQPAWLAFLANPVLNFSKDATADTRATECWVAAPSVDYPGVTCTPREYLNNLAARMPWDVDPRTYLPTNTTAGNAAVTAEAWTTPLTPGPIGQRPFQPDRTYNDEFSDKWNNSQCSTTELVPGGNDILASVTNLFTGHNRFHDYSYYLGYTEDNYNLQQTNFGNLGADGDPEVGNVQAGAITGGPPSYLGRDNANQITLQDGVPGITNQYLFQPIAAGFYSPCVDGDFDASVFGHEYTHSISGRMVAGPDSGLSGFQAGSMGEAWSDQVALEYLFSHDYDLGTTNPWVEGPYVTGNKTTGIRNYALNKNPLQYGDLGYDSTGPEVHADGEVWNAAMWNVRQALVNKWNPIYAYNDKDLQRHCAEGFRGTRSPHGPLPASRCPGNIRWITLMFDSFLLQQSATSMLDARDAMLAADRMRFKGNNQTVIWDAFARTGMGKNAVSKGTADTGPKPGYVSPLSKEGTLRVKAVSGGTNVPGELYVSKYEARITPAADTSSKTKLGNSLAMVPGTYDFTFRAPGYGITSFRSTVKAGQTTLKTLNLKRNLASMSSGAKIDGTTGAGDPKASRNPGFLIDDTQGTNWGVKTSDSVGKSHPVINVDLAGGVHTVRTVRVSAQLRPTADSDVNSRGLVGTIDEDPESGSRFTAMRSFAIEVCTQSCSGTGTAGYRRIFTSSPDAFNSVRPRPLVPTTLMKTFNVPDTKATHVRLVMLDNQCTGFAGFHGEQDADPINNTDCITASNKDQIGHAAELEVFE
jgi:extracellular elastinolytic metalloproteinase